MTGLTLERHGCLEALAGGAFLAGSRVGLGLAGGSGWSEPSLPHGRRGRWAETLLRPGRWFAAVVMCGLLAATSGVGRAAQPCCIEVVEKGSGWPVPLVELRTTHNVTFVTDNAGVIAFDLPELMGRETWFGIQGHGYELPKDGFGYRGVRLKPGPGGRLKLEVTRTSIAKRLGRLTGAGVFGESQKLGLETDREESGVVGCDSVQNAVHEGRIFWVWGDTTLGRYPLGIFNASAATTSLSPLREQVPPVHLRFALFKGADGQPRGVGDIPGDGPTWFSALVSLPDEHGRPHLVTTYAKIKPPLDAYKWGLAEWDERRQVFASAKVLWTNGPAAPKPPPLPDGHAAFWSDSHGKRWVLFGNPFPTLRLPASYEAWLNPESWERLEPQENLRDANGGDLVEPHSGSVAWNGWRRKWVTIFMQKFGKPSAFGEVWYAEAPAPTGPWGPAVKVASHEHYTFYNPRVHSELSFDDSPILLFEGTYTMQFSDAKQPTSRYDYNQILYRLDLDDPKLAGAQPGDEQLKASSPRQVPPG